MAKTSRRVALEGKAKAVGEVMSENSDRQAGKGLENGDNDVGSIRKVGIPLGS